MQIGAVGSRARTLARYSKSSFVRYLRSRDWVMIVEELRDAPMLGTQSNSWDIVAKTFVRQPRCGLVF